MEILQRLFLTRPVEWIHASWSRLRQREKKRAVIVLVGKIGVRNGAEDQKDASRDGQGRVVADRSLVRWILPLGFARESKMTFRKVNFKSAMTQMPLEEMIKSAFLGLFAACATRCGEGASADSVVR
jgi:hypothetical protein